MSQVVFDERATKQLEVMYRSRDIVRRRGLVREALGARVGDRILDVGCGPGFASAELLAEVGPTGAVIGIDSSEAMLAAARRRCTGLGDSRFYAASATRLPLDDRSVDRALCVQVLEFVPEPALALAELYRVLRPGGRALVWDVDWSTLSWYSAEPARMQRMLQAWDRHLTHPALPRLLTAALRQAGFTDVQATGYAFTTTTLDPETYGGFALGAVQQYLAGLPDLDQTEVKAWADEQRALDTSGRYYYAVLQVCFTGTRPG